MSTALTTKQKQPALRINVWFNDPLEYAQWLANGGKLPQRLEVHQRRLHGRIIL